MNIEFTHDELELILTALYEYQISTENEDDLIVNYEIQSKILNANKVSV